MRALPLRYIKILFLLALCALGAKRAAADSLSLSEEEEKKAYDIFLSRTLSPEKRDALAAGMPVLLDRWSAPIHVAIVLSKDPASEKADRKIIAPLFESFSQTTGVAIESADQKADILLFLFNGEGKSSQKYAKQAKLAREYLAAAGAPCATLPVTAGDKPQVILAADLRASWKDQRQCLGNGIASALGLHGNIAGNPAFRPGETGPLQFSKEALIAFALLYSPDLHSGMTPQQLREKIENIAHKMAPSSAN